MDWPQVRMNVQSRQYWPLQRPWRKSISILTLCMIFENMLILHIKELQQQRQQLKKPMRKFQKSLKIKERNLRPHYQRLPITYPMQIWGSALLLRDGRSNQFHSKRIQWTTRALKLVKSVYKSRKEVFNRFPHREIQWVRKVKSPKIICLPANLSLHSRSTKFRNWCRIEE